jgi:hypothetical protein
VLQENQDRSIEIGDARYDDNGGPQGWQNVAFPGLCLTPADNSVSAAVPMARPPLVSTTADDPTDGGMVYAEFAGEGTEALPTEIPVPDCLGLVLVDLLVAELPPPLTRR